MGRPRKCKRRRLTAKAAATAAREGDAVIPALPGELILEILWRVPAKCVLQLRCVCKSWKSLISERQFMIASLERSFSDIDASASRAVKGLDAITSVLASVQYADLSGVLLDSIISTLEIVGSELQQLKRGIVLYQNFLKIYNSR